MDDSFLDFFNNDEDFMEFEHELEKFKSNRRSRVLDGLNRRSSCDIFGDVKAFCDRSLKSDSSRDSTKGSDHCDRDSKMWNSAEEWDFVLNKLKRNSRLFSDKGPPPDCDIFSEEPIYVHKIQVEDQPSRDKDCQYTCHHNCVGSVTLDCTSVSQGSPNGEDTPKTGSAAETSLSQPKLRNSPKSVISKNNVLQSSQNEDISQRLAQLSTSSVPGVAQRVEHTVDNSVDVPADNTNKSHIGKLKKEKDETDSGYRSGTIPDEKLPKMPSQATLNRDELRRKIAEYNHLVPGSEFELTEEQGEAFQGFIKVTLNLIRPITMSLSMRPPSIYDLLTKEHIIEQNTQSVSFYMPRDTIKSIHVASETTTKEVVAALLKKFHILDHPRKFAMYEQEFSKNKLVRLKRVGDKDFPLQVFLNWDPRRFTNYRLVLQENETGEIVWEGFSRPELNNFLKVLDREEEECVSQLHYKYKVMKRIINQRLKELRKERKTSGTSPS
ncbi:ras association domain-containing protein 1 homolog isoform X3 [Haliotis cracherodii]|uniref:ras association domain-containing protein 1 homolog isoform X3 n=1 Tax=Haliotis cracherodii TaxID=6455 RepID=UPI0039E87094